MASRSLQVYTVQHLITPATALQQHSMSCCRLAGILYGGIGVTDAAEAQAAIKFAKRFEILKGDEAKRLRLQEVDLTSESSIAETVPWSDLTSYTHSQQHQQKAYDQTECNPCSVVSPSQVHSHCNCQPAGIP